MPFIKRQMIHRSIRSAMNFPTGSSLFISGCLSGHHLTHCNISKALLDASHAQNPCHHPYIGRLVAPLSLHYVQSDFFEASDPLQILSWFPYVPFTHKEPLLASKQMQTGSGDVFQMSLGMSRPYRFSPVFAERLHRRSVQSRSPLPHQSSPGSSIVGPVLFGKRIPTKRTIN